MASIIPKTKDGKIISYKFKACVGRDDCGKQVFRCMTWKVPGGLGPVKAEKAAEKAAAAWEQEAKAEYGKDLQDAERARQREIARCKTDFVYFVKNVWFPSVLRTANTSRKRFRSITIPPRISPPIDH